MKKELFEFKQNIDCYSIQTKNMKQIEEIKNIFERFSCKKEKEKKN